MKKIIIAFVFFISTILVVKPTLAQSVNLSISPSQIELYSKPGKNIVVPITIKNYGDPTLINLQAYGLESKDELGALQISNTPYVGPIKLAVLNSSLDFGKTIFLDSNKEEKFDLEVSSLDNTPNKDYYFTLLAKSQPSPGKEGEKTVKISTAVGSNFYLTITENGQVEVNAKINKFRLTSKYGLNIFDSKDTIPLTFLIENIGKNLIKPNGKIILRGNFGEKISYDIYPENILANSVKIVRTEKSSANTSAIFSGFFIGKYDISTSLNFGDGTPTFSASTSFFAFPFKLFLIFLLIIAVIVFVVLKLKKRSNM